MYPHSTTNTVCQDSFDTPAIFCVAEPLLTTKLGLPALRAPLRASLERESYSKWSGAKCILTPLQTQCTKTLSTLWQSSVLLNPFLAIWQVPPALRAPLRASLERGSFCKLSGAKCILIPLQTQRVKTLLTCLTSSGPLKPFSTTHCQSVPRRALPGAIGIALQPLRSRT